MRPEANQLIEEKHRAGAAQYAAATAMAYPVSATVPAAGDAVPRGPTPWPSLRTIFSTLWASAAMYPSQSTFHGPRNRGFSHPRRSREAKVPCNAGGDRMTTHQRSAKPVGKTAGERQRLPAAAVPVEPERGGHRRGRHQPSHGGVCGPRGTACARVRRLYGRPVSPSGLACGVPGGDRGH